MKSRLRIPAALLAALLAGAAPAAEPPVIDNPAQPAGGVAAVAMHELWRAGGEDDDIFFGNVGAVRIGPDGNCYILDSQLSQVQVYAPDGRHLATLGREGDGPGEVRGAGDMFVADDGTVCLLQAFPGRIVKLTPDGLPAGEAVFRQGLEPQGQFAVMVSGLADGPGMVLCGIRMTMGGSVSRQTYFLARCDADAQQQAVLLEKESVIDYADFRLSEAGMDFVWNRLAIGPDGTVYAAADRDAYAVTAYGRDGAPLRIIRRAYETPIRDERQRALQRQVLEAVGANYPLPPREIVVLEAPPVIDRLYALEDGRLLVAHVRGQQERPAGAWLVLDEFDAAGRFTRQLALQGGHDPERDFLALLPGGRAVVVVGALDAFLNQQGTAGEATAAAGNPLEVICYRLELD